MIALQITELKTFMNALLRTEAFDDFLLQEATLQMAIGYVFDGHINKDFFGEDSADATQMDFVTYGEVRPTLFELIKGKRTPLGLQLVLQLSPERSAILFPDGLSKYAIKGLNLNIRYDGSKVILTSGINYATFSLDKTPELIWDEALMRLLEQVGIAYETL